MSEQLPRVTTTIRALQCWTVGVLTAFGFLLKNESSLENFYKFGPSSTLIIMGLTIDTIALYSGIVIYCLVNTIIRNLNNQLVVPWITLVVHDTTVDKKQYSYFKLQEIVMMSAFYTWIDWFIYVNIVFSQADVVLIELFAEMLITYIVTRMYLMTPVPTEPLPDLSSIAPLEQTQSQ
jgi:hypothetical protein